MQNQNNNNVNRKEKRLTTQIRTMHSEDMYMTMKFSNVDLSIYLNKNKTSSMNIKPLWIMIDYSQASALIEFIEKSLEVENPGYCKIEISRPYMTLKLERSTSSLYTITLKTTNDDRSIIFPFKTSSAIINNTNVMIHEGIIEFKGVLTGYTESLNADRHYDKLTEKYISEQESKTSSKPVTPYNNKPYNNNRNQPSNNRMQYQSQQQSPQNFTNYRIEN